MIGAGLRVAALALLLSGWEFGVNVALAYFWVSVVGVVALILTRGSSSEWPEKMRQRSRSELVLLGTRDLIDLAAGNSPEALDALSYHLRTQRGEN